MRFTIRNQSLAAIILFAGLPLSAQVNPDACKQVREDDVATLVTLNQSTVEARDQTRPGECEWDVKTPLSFMGAEVQLSIRHFDSHGQAVAYMKNELPFYFDKKPSLVKTSGPDDHVDDLLDRPDWAQAEAVHGEYMAKVEANRIEPGARSHPTFEYRLQRLALQAAGATILPTVGLPPDPVPPKAQSGNLNDSAHARSASVLSWPSGIAMAVLVALVLGAILRRTRRSGAS